MTRFHAETSPTLLVVIALSLAAVFAIDLLTPLGVADWILYLVPVVLALYVRRPWMPLLVALGATLLIVLGFELSRPGPSLPVEVARINRSLATLVIWATAFIVRQFVLVNLQLRERDWVRTGQRDLGARMQGEGRVDVLADAVLRFLCEYTGAAVGALYIRSDEGRLVRRAGYGLSAAGEAPPVVAEGEGLLGQAMKDGRLLRVDDPPEGYLTVASTLGHTRPQHVLAVPARAESGVVAGLELGFLRRVGISESDLLSAVAEPIAVAIKVAQYRTRQQELLAETRHQAERLQAQQEELRAGNEELEEQSRALQESQARLEEQQVELEQTNAQLEEQAQQLEQQRDELERVQAQLVSRADALERANQYKSEFLANMSHELRTPLNSALILAKLLADNRDGNLTPEQAGYAATIHAAGHDLLSLINDILDLSRIEAGRMEIKPEPVRLARVVEDLGRVFQPVASQKGLELSVRLLPGTPETLTSDALRLQQILRNLLSNALKFTERGQVSLEVAPDGAGGVRVAVRDTGIGIPAAQHEVIFEAFRQADGSTHRKYGGTGLGLTISRELARRLGGDIEVESEPGRGSTFTLLLPAALSASQVAGVGAAAPGLLALPGTVVPPTVAVDRPAAAATSPRAGGAPPAVKPVVEDDRDSLRPGERRILVIEDDPAFARILRDFARKAGFRCVVATRAEEGLQLARQHAASAVLLDVHLPDSSGLGVLEALKGDARTRHLPVHVLSVADYARQSLERGAVGFLQKPVDREQLDAVLERLEQALEQRVRRVLVVEDAAVQRESVVALLRSAKVEVVAVGSGAQALEQLSRSTWDCLVLDLALPDMSGFELLDRIAAGDGFAFPPVIVYTCRELEREEEDRLRRYARSIILKGARSPERLLDEVTLFLHQVESSLPAEQQRVLREVRSREAALEDRRILVVEDDVRNVFALTSVLEPRGAQVSVARNGKEALAALELSRGRDGGGFDLVLMDIMMPEMDGLTAMREIRRRPEWKGIPIIALTAKAMPDDRDRCFEAGANDYIAKPLDLDRLLSLVRVWIAR